MRRGTEYGCFALSLTARLEAETREDDAMQKPELSSSFLGFVGVGVFSALLG